MVGTVLVVAFFVYLALGNLHQVTNLPWGLTHFSDFYVKHKAAERIAEGQLLYRDHVRYASGVYHYPPVFLYSLGAVYRLVGARLVVGKAVLSLFTVLCAAVLFPLVEIHRDRQTARLATGLFLASPVTLVAAYAGYFDPFVAFLLLLSVYALLRGHPGVAGVVLGLGVMSKLFPALLFPLGVVYCLETDEVSLSRFVAGFLVVLAGVSVPFLVSAPEAYVHYAFLFNFERPTASLSLYYYFLPWLESTLAPTVLPAGFVAAFTYWTYRSDIGPTTVLVVGPAGLFLGFLLLNRINYPHYLIYVVPFFSAALADAYRTRLTVRGHLLWRYLVAAFAAVAIGAAVWTYPWLGGVERLGIAHYNFKASPYFWIGSGIYFLSGFGLLATLCRSIVEPE